MKTTNDRPAAPLVAAVAMLVLAIPLAPVAAQGDSWQPSSKNGDQSAFVENSSIVREGDTVRFWREIRSAQPRALEGGGERYDRFGSLIEANCETMEFRTLELYIKLGEEELARGAPAEKLDTAKPGSTVETDIKVACAHGW